jgi:Xaa-Pro dipeptidase
MPPVRDLFFTGAEYAERLATVRRKMHERGADVLIVDETEHLFYLTGFIISGTTYQACIIPFDQEPVMVLRSMDKANFLEQSWLSDYVTFADIEDPIAVVARTLSKRSWSSKCIGFELDSHYLTVRRHQTFRDALPEATFVDFSEILWELRLRKSPQEIAYLRIASQIADAMMLQAINAIGEGKSEREAAIAACRTLIEMGGDLRRPGLVTSGRRSGSIHGVLGDHRLERGDLVHMEFTPRFHNYSGRLIRPTVIGPPSRDQAETARQLIAIQDEQIAAMRPGAVAKDIDRICREQVLAAGLRDVYENVTGYTVGCDVLFPPPRITDLTRTFLPTSDWVLEPGMTFHMYTWARNMSFSETVLVTEIGHERLTQLERKLFIR